MSAPITAGLVVGSLPSQALAEKIVDRLKLLVVGAHPDDPETGCGGIMAKYVKNGHEVVSVYLTLGEGGISSKTNAEAAAIRTEEAKKRVILLVHDLFLLVRLMAIQNWMQNDTMI